MGAGWWLQRHHTVGASTNTIVRAVTTRGSVHPHERPWARTSADEPRVIAASPIPTTSGSEPTTCFSVSTLTPSVRIKAITPTGTCTKNALRQPKRSTRPAPSEGPSAPATAPTAVHMAITRVASPFGQTASTSASDDGNTNAAPRPCTPRPTSSTHIDGAQPPMIEPSTNSPRPTMNVVRRPLRSPIRPTATSDDAMVMV